MTETVSWRDVRDTVAESKKEILTAIEQLRRDKETVHLDHEQRLRAVEDKTDAVQFLTRAVIILVTVVAAASVILHNLGII